MSDAELVRLSAAVHDRVMGRGGACWCGPEAGGYDPQSGACKRCGLRACPRYSSDMAAAWAVVERLTEWPYVKVHAGSSYWHGDFCTVIAPHPSQRDDDCPVVRNAVGVWGESAPEAICRAALAAVEGKADG